MLAPRGQHAKPHPECCSVPSCGLSMLCASIYTRPDFWVSNRASPFPQPYPCEFIHLHSNGATVLTADSTTCRHRPLCSVSLVESYSWKGGTCPRTQPMHMSSLSRPHWKTIIPSRQTATSSPTWLVGFGLSYRSTTLGFDRRI